MSLSNLQAELADLLLSDAVNTDLVMPPENIVIYQNNVQSAFMAALKDTYPLIHQLVGDACFQQAAREYTLQYPSRNSNLHEYGEYFGHFLSRFLTTAEFHLFARSRAV